MSDDADIAWMKELPTMIRNALLQWNLRAKDDVRREVESGEIRKVNNIGNKSFAWLCAYFAIPQVRRVVSERIPLARHRCPKCGHGW